MLLKLYSFKQTGFTNVIKAIFAGLRGSSVSVVEQSARNTKSNRSARNRNRSLEMISLESRQLLSTFTVSNTADTGVGSLRQAIISANKATGASTINFSIGSGSQTISLKSALPTITTNVTIDGTSQPGYAGTPLITLNGSSAGSNVNGLELAGGNDVVLGLAIDSFSGNGIQLDGKNNTISGNYIGVDATGTKAAGNGGCGVNAIWSSSGNVIGGTTALTRNVISANGASDPYNCRGVLLNGSNKNTIEGNYFGTNAAGTAALGNFGDDVCLVSASNNTIGGTAPGAGNLISGSGRVGIWLNGWTTNYNTIQGNLIGTDVTGKKSIANGQNGIMIEKGSNHITIGGTQASASNLVSGNRWNGILVCGVSSTGTGNVTIQGNKVGTTLAGTDSLKNGEDGIQVNWGATNVTIGGTTPGSGNLISGNGNDGVHIMKAPGNSIKGNYIGTDVTGKLPLRNAFDGIYIGTGRTSVSNNVIAANGSNGIWVNGQGKVTVKGDVFDTDGKTEGDVFVGNKIGVNAAGTALPNGNDGMYLLKAGEIQIGGTAAGAQNIIAGNAANGTYADGTTATGTSMKDNGGWSIEVVGESEDLKFSNNQILTVTATVNLEEEHHTITVGSQKGQKVFKLIS